MSKNNFMGFEAYKYKNKIRLGYFSFIFFLLFAVILSFYHLRPGKTSPGDSMSGWLYSLPDGSGNVEWISLNSQNCINLNIETPGTCTAGAGYGVTVAGGNVSGVAWSENFGWICFGNTCNGPLWVDLALVNTPDGGPSFATYDGIKFTGWANIYSMKQDGWISLQGNPTAPLPVVEGSTPYKSCFNCDYVGGVICNSCFTDVAADCGLAGNVCYGCTGCTSTSTPPVKCAVCNNCNKYGLIGDPNGNLIRGWAWNGVDIDNDAGHTADIGMGWIKPYSNALFNAFPWLEVKYGNVYSVSGIQGSGAPPNKYNATYCVQSNNTITNFTSGNGCLAPSFESINVPTGTNSYTNVLGKLDRGGILNGNYGVVEEIVTNNAKTHNLAGHAADDQASYDKNLEGKIYHFLGNKLTINKALRFMNASNGDGSGLIIVEGDLFIDRNITYELNSVSKIEELASVGWLVRGRLVIDPSVTEIVGAFYVEGDNGIATGASGNKLIVHGLMIAKRYNFQRTFRSTDEGSEQIVYDGRALINTPPGMEDLTKSLPLWKESAP